MFSIKSNIPILSCELSVRDNSKVKETLRSTRITGNPVLLADCTSIELGGILSLALPADVNQMLRRYFTRYYDHCEEESPLLILKNYPVSSLAFHALIFAMSSDFNDDHLTQATPRGLFHQQLAGNESQAFHIDTGSPEFVMLGCTKNASRSISTDFVPNTSAYEHLKGRSTEEVQGATSVTLGVNDAVLFWGNRFLHGRHNHGRISTHRETLAYEANKFAIR